MPKICQSVIVHTNVFPLALQSRYNKDFFEKSSSMYHEYASNMNALGQCTFSQRATRKFQRLQR